LTYSTNIAQWFWRRSHPESNSECNRRAWPNLRLKESDPDKGRRGGRQIRETPNVIGNAQDGFFTGACLEQRAFKRVIAFHIDALPCHLDERNFGILATNYSLRRKLGQQFSADVQRTEALTERIAFDLSDLAKIGGPQPDRVSSPRKVVAPLFHHQYERQLV
jgi:hypothetical protein